MKAKIRGNLTKILSVTLGAVFAFSVGGVYAASFYSSIDSNKQVTTTYAANQSYAIINDTQTQPISFGTGAKNCQVSIKYDYSYQFDMRIKYQLGWTSGSLNGNSYPKVQSTDSYNQYQTYYTATLKGGAGYYATTATITDATDFTTQRPKLYILSSGVYEKVATDATYSSGTTYYKVSDQYATDVKAGLYYLDGSTYIRMTSGEKCGLNSSYYTLSVASVTSATFSSLSSSLCYLSTDNVILKYANRSELIVDNNYIYYIGTQSSISSYTLPSGSGVIDLFTGVDFVDSEDSAYVGENLVINISEVKVAKAVSTYDATSTLCSDIVSGSLNLSSDTDQGSMAAITWLKYKNKSTISGAYAVVYDKGYNSANGTAYPTNDTAYYTATNDSTTWLGGNKYYVGLGIYIITGNSAVKIKANVYGSWNSINSDVYTRLPTFENNILYNYSTGWSMTGTSSSGDIYTYTYEIPANSAVYIDCVDSIEITSRARFRDSGSNSDTGSDRVTTYDNFRALTSVVLNDSFQYDATQFTHSSYAGYNNGICGKTITTISATTSTYSTNLVTVNNSTLYQPAMYDKSLGGAQDFYANITVTNNTTTTKTISMSSCNITLYISNGATSIAQGDSFSSGSWYRSVVTSLSGYISTTETTSNLVVAPHTTVNLFTSYQISSSLATYLQTNYGEYDAWVVLNPVVSVTNSGTATSLGVEATYSGSTLTISVKNNTTNVVTGASVGVSGLQLQGNAPTTISTQPSDWDTDYWKYYILSNGVYIKNTSSYYSGTYYEITETWQPLTISSPTYYNGFSLSSSKYVSTTLKLLPNESVKVLSCTLSESGIVNFAQSTATATASTATTASADVCYAVNENSANCYIQNLSLATSYYIRFNATLSGSNSYFVTDNGYTYYIGMIRPGQTISITLNSSVDSLAIEKIECNDRYVSTDLSSWSPASTVTTAFNTMFGVS